MHLIQGSTPLHADRTQLHSPSTHRRRHLLLSLTHLRDRCLDCCRDGCNCLLWHRLNLDRHRAARVVEVAAVRRLCVPCLRGRIWTSGKIVRRRCTIATAHGAGDHHARIAGCVRALFPVQRPPNASQSGAKEKKNIREKQHLYEASGFPVATILLQPHANSKTRESIGQAVPRSGGGGSGGEPLVQ